MKRFCKIVGVALFAIVLVACGLTDGVVTREIVMDSSAVTSTVALLQTIPGTSTPVLVLTPSPNSFTSDASASQTPNSVPTLGDRLVEYRLPTNTLPDDVLNQKVFEYLNTEHAFLVSYFGRSTSTQSPYSIRFLKFDKVEGVWSSTEIIEPTPNEDCSFTICYFSPGAVTYLVESKGFYLVGTHLNPSAGFTFVLTSDLELHDVLFGYVRQQFADGTVVLRESIMHFAPTHYTLLDIYKPSTRELYRIFPHEPYQALWLTHEQKVAQIYDDLGSAWCVENNHHCNPELFNNYVAGDVVINNDTDSIAFIITFSGSSDSNLEETRTVYIYRNIHDNSLLEYREASEDELLSLVGTADLERLLEKETLDFIFSHVEFIAEPTSTP
ncbi:MAG: hypothetical protein IT327_31020 [Anaerolineae bacterium]|nr:hypothetical protein [Anaerolineae bacterium]